MSQEKPAVVLGGCLMSLVVVAVATVYHAMLLYYGWNMFVADLVGQRMESAWTAFGVAVTAAAFRHLQPPGYKDPQAVYAEGRMKEEPVTFCALRIASYAIAALFAAGFFMLAKRMGG